jgi:CheY-like chemotaxis protein
MSNKIRVLLADDSRFFRSIESKFLQKTPVEVLEVEDTASALDLIRREMPDLVYMSFALPKDGGPACCKAIKSDPELRSIPVVIVCAQGEPEQPELARRAGCDDLLIKPLDRHSFLQVGRKFLAGIREHRQPSFFRVTLTFDGEEFKGKSLDISGGGMFLDCQADIPVGTELNLTFDLPDDLKTQVNCNAVVTWLNRKPNPMKPHYPHGIGLRFVDLPEFAHRAILRMNEKKTPA